MKIVGYQEGTGFIKKNIVSLKLEGDREIIAFLSITAKKLKLNEDQKALIDGIHNYIRL